jgi:hypothetical protein
VAIHAANSCLVGALLWRRARAHGPVIGGAAAATAIATLAFALHPVQTEAVTYISGRSVSLAALPCLLALTCWLAGQDAATRGAALAWRGLSMLAFALALGVKETAIVLPLALLLSRKARARAERQMEPSVCSGSAFAAWRAAADVRSRAGHRRSCSGRLPPLTGHQSDRPWVDL